MTFNWNKPLSIFPMFSDVMSLGFAKHQILDVIVGRVAVNVVNNFFGAKESAKMLFHHVAMFVHPIPSSNK